MDSEAFERAARLIARSRCGGAPLDTLPADCQPPDEAAAYAVQRRVHARLSQAGLGPVAGYKIGCTTPVMQAFLGIDHPCAGGVLAGGVQRGEGRFRYADFRRIGVECEIVVELGEALECSGAPYDRQGAGAAVRSCMAGIELVDDRYRDYRALDAWTLIADDFFNAGGVLGLPVVDWRGLDLAALGGRMSVNGVEVGRGHGADIMGHPLEALAWLANLTARRGRDLPAGAFVFLGSMVRTCWLDGPATVEVAVEGLGSARATLV